MEKLCHWKRIVGERMSLQQWKENVALFTERLSSFIVTFTSMSINRRGERANKTSLLLKWQMSNDDKRQKDNEEKTPFNSLVKMVTHSRDDQRVLPLMFWSSATDQDKSTKSTVQQADRTARPLINISSRDAPVPVITGGLGEKWWWISNKFINGLDISWLEIELATSHDWYPVLSLSD